jgi:hypothetical protein
MKTVNLEKILLKYPTFNNQGGYGKEYVLQAMKEACRQTLELAAENSKVIFDDYDDFLNGNETYITDKDSILNTINQVK